MDRRAAAPQSATMLSKVHNELLTRVGKMEPATRPMRVEAVRFEAEGVLSFELRQLQGELAPVEAGAHVDLHLPGGHTRSYSLCNAPGETHRYVVAVARDAASRGGSAYLHERVRPGQIIDVSGPRNNFALDRSAAHSVLIAGGIGVTPMYAMAQGLAAAGRRWEIHYAARNRRVAAFVPSLAGLAGQGKVHFHFDDEKGGRPLDLKAIIAAAPVGSHFYCCGPGAMIDAFQSAAAGLPPEQVHVEHFKAPAKTPKDNVPGRFEVMLARSGRVLHVDEGRSILDTLLDAGVDVPFSCMEGICGSCELAVIEGEPDHRDMLLSAAERKAGKTIMVCCSRAKSERLVLDA
jgi:tetrachlorobenzoquinone reductase